MNFHRRHLNWLPNWQLKKQGGALILQKAVRGWGGSGFSQKNLHASLDLLNEPNFGGVLLAGHYL
jgi:hypothetical protein